MTLRISFLMTAALALQGCDYDPPMNWSADKEAKNVISGTLVAQGIDAPSDVTLFVFAADDQGPPFGTGRPLTFSTVSASSFSANASGQQTAAYAIPYLHDSDPENDSANNPGAGYVVTALMDMDDNFNPFATGTVGATCGDWTGAHYTALEGGTLGSIYVSGGEVADNITVTLDTPVETQRPAFLQLSNDHPITFSRAQGRASGADPAGLTQNYRIRSTAVHTSYGDNYPLDLNGPCAPEAGVDPATCVTASNCKCDPIAADPCDTAFRVQFIDADGDGVHDPYPAVLQAENGLKDVWPRIYIEYQGLPESDENGDEVFRWEEREEYEWPLGSGKMNDERIVGESYPMAFFLNFGGVAASAPAGAPFDAFSVHEMSVTWSPVVRRYHENAVDYEDATGPFDVIDVRCFTDQGGYPTFATCPVSQREVAVDEIPVGAWNMTVVSRTGQNWTVPNEIGSPAMAYAIGIDEAMASTSGDFQVNTQSTYVITE